ncbi:unnamed protein product [Ambrosiozyma monospora]|uniref:Unnamed protein product n=1 Tax=Ambrosiozyma monospora TaxID=43982 RepID=A0ACB5TDJ4_AMBMO|nr:unnamed protein product [Ambrosiozyma monospora]
MLGIPAIIYLAFFYVHLTVLVHEGDGGAFLSSAFRSSFDDSNVPKSVFADVGVSSVVTLKHVNTHGGYLHSHDHLYEGGSGQQQVTLYPHLDDNNKWAIELYNVTEEPLEFVPITQGTKIRLKHLLTSRRLHSHDIRPAVSEIEWQNEASCYGYEGFEGDPNDDFIVEIQKELSAPGEAQKRVRAIETVFRLRHAMTGCYLFSHETKLPKWGFEQQEVTCATQGIKPLSLWYIEENQNLYLDYNKAERISYPNLTFFQKFVELHKRMWEINSGLTQPHVYESRPESWPILSRGISYWRSDDHQIYLLGNPVVWWIASFIFLPFGLYIVAQIICWQYGTPLSLDAEIFNYNLSGLEYILGWFLHYYPSFLMARQLFLHHYIPALYFAILALGQTLEFVYSKVLKGKKIVSYALFVLLLSASIHAFLQRTPIIYGSDWTREQCEASQLLSRWDYDCKIYPDAASLSSSNVVPPAPQSTGSPINFDDAIQVEEPQPQQEQEQQKPLIQEEAPLKQEKEEIIVESDPSSEPVEETVNDTQSEVQHVVEETPAVEGEEAAVAVEDVSEASC